MVVAGRCPGLDYPLELVGVVQLWTSLSNPGGLLGQESYLGIAYNGWECVSAGRGAQLGLVELHLWGRDPEPSGEVEQHTESDGDPDGAKGQCFDVEVD